MVIFQDIVDYFKSNTDIVDFNPVLPFIEEKTNICLLTILIDALEAGLNLDLIDRDKFNNSNVDTIEINITERIQGGGFCRIQIDNLLREGNSFSYYCSFEKFGYSFAIRTVHYLLQMTMDFEDKLNCFFNTTPVEDEGLFQVNDLLVLLNNPEPRAIKKNRWRRLKDYFLIK